MSIDLEHTHRLALIASGAKVLSLKAARPATRLRPAQLVVCGAAVQMVTLQTLVVQHTPIIWAGYSRATHTLLTAAATHMALWNVVTGDLIRVIGRDILFPGHDVQRAGAPGSSPSEADEGSPTAEGPGHGGKVEAGRGAALISAVCADQRDRSFFTGDSWGRIRRHNWMNGAVMQVGADCWLAVVTHRDAALTMIRRAHRSWTRMPAR